MSPYALIPCAAHVPPRCRVRRKSVCEIHAGHRAAINALYPKIESKTGPRTDQNVVRRYPKPFKIQPGGTQAHPDATKRCPRAAKRCSKDTQERPRDAHEHPRGGQERPKKRQKRTQEVPRVLQNRFWHVPRHILGAFFAGTFVRKALGSDFDRFSRIAFKRKP